MELDELLSKISELAQTGVAKAKELTDAGVAKTKELTEIGRLRVENATEQEAIKKAYLEIGKLYFAERGMAPEAPYTALCEKIAASKAKIEYNQERIADMKAASAVAVEVVEEEGEVPAEEPAEAEPVVDEPAPEEPAAEEPKDEE